MTTTTSTNGKPSTDSEAAPPLSFAGNGAERKANGHAAPVPHAGSAPSFIALDKGAEPRDLSATADGRDPKTGRFLKGAWRGGQGNPFYRRVAQLRAQAVCEITPDEVRALMRRLYGQAMSGDTASAVVLLAYLLGKPAKVVDPDAADDDQWRRLRDVPSQEEFACANVNGIPTDEAIDKLRQCREVMDPFDKQWRPHGQHILDEMAAQRKRRK
jgi:hypothetical protein